MMTRLLQIGSIVLCSLVATSPARAQVTSDGTLTTPTEVVNPSENVFQIDGGTEAGSNLFHSFQEFSIINGQEIRFNNSGSIANIISRVTGRNISNIDGVISAMGNANLFLINPAGILFGDNASLNIGGSFYASTADALVFQDGTVFSAKNPTARPLLTINVPFGLQLGSAAGSITNEAGGIQGELSDTSEDIGNNRVLDGGLEVDPGETLALIGGDITLDNGNAISPGGRVELGGLSEAGNR